ncbi:mannose-1-phosphate guanylyltransferase/mannose-6-phosphate isomerase [Salinicola sp. JS01]|uniref:mannose-1-phosphate guanylyltransferase/mannose-6-phosphate isomerase n=1 Tax=Salinicola sp. JS01 TaxID=3050071 RepID=UPI00255BCDE5|nr:mannose-1-phosphate guanylyltransferase/mannose-6-phosphate isomerase [Salinicola sp. JS01]WIX34547.1 mannose-1-phosphate guanylyltransferase/mannose-6-phosphate isomerase [Salinicola sp. JS01]
MLIPVVLAGGAGTRLWPMSRASFPKQFLPVVGPRSMLLETLDRFVSVEPADPIVVCQEAHRFVVAEQLREAGWRAEILLEPAPRNTAPAIALAALQAMVRDPDAMLLVLPADHAIRDPEALRAALGPAQAAARQGRLVTFGVTPTRAETGYGYIETSESPSEAFAVPIQRFVEKPDAATAEAYLASGRYLWNSGMFLMRADRYLEELGAHRPDMLDAVTAAWEARQSDLDFLRVAPAPFAACEAESVDFAVMENTAEGCVVALDAGWSDVGSWQALWEIADKDAAGNALSGDVITEDVHGSLIRAESRLVTAVGIDDLLIVETPDAVLVTHREQAQEVKRIAAALKRDNRSEWDLHRRVHRPWGSYDGVHRAARYQVKHICVAPGGRLSLQQHFHRAEHWVVVCGTARVTCGDDTFLLTENQSTYIPLGVVHRLENPGKIPLELIEIQSGSYLGEDDIERFDDVYRRD